VLIVTPVIFFWVQERRLGLERDVVPRREGATMNRRGVLIATGILAIAGIAIALLWRSSALPGDQGAAGDGRVVQTVGSDGVDVVLLSSTGTLRQGRNAFTIEFRRPGTTTLVDAGTVRASATMPMPGMAMSGGLQVNPTRTAGRYEATAEFGMAGTWQMTIEWDGPVGAGSVSFQGGVQ
jgi:hypothetical protein